MWRRKGQPTPVFLPGESQGRRSLVGCCLWGCTESDMTEATWQQQQQYRKWIQKEMQEGKVVVWGCFAYSWGKKSKRQGRKGKMYPTEWRVLENSKEEKKEAFLNEQYKEIGENNRMQKTGDLFKKIESIKGTFHARMGTIKDGNGMALTEAEEIKNRW